MKTTKLTLLVLVAVMLAVFAAACGNNNNNGNASSPAASEPAASGSSSPANSASEEPAATTKTITDGLDRAVEIPVNPQRVVVLGNFGEVTALGIKPVGTLGYYIDKYGAERTAGAENIGQDTADVEKVLALKPDLIIIPSYFKPEELEGLSKIAPTIATKWGLLPLEHLHILAEWLGKEAEEQAWLTQYNEKAAQAKEQLKSFNLEGQKAVVIQFWSKKIYQHATGVFSPLFKDIGFVPTEAESKLTATTEISEEAVVDYVADADKLFILVDGQADIDTYNTLKASAWKNIPAVKNDQVYLVESPRWNDYSTAAMEWMLEDLVKIIK